MHKILFFPGVTQATPGPSDLQDEPTFTAEEWASIMGDGPMPDPPVDLKPCSSGTFDKLRIASKDKGENGHGW